MTEQSSTAWNGEDWFEEAIADAGVPPNPIDPKRVSEIWRKLDRLSTLAEARLRLSLHALDEPILADYPKWLSDSDVFFPAVSVHRRLLHAGVALEPGRSAIMLTRAFAFRHPEAVAEFETTSDGSITIRWNDVRGLRFIVSRPTLRWPAVNARAYWRPNPEEAPLECRYARIAHELLELPYKKV
jgi:hypothetical protein